MKISNSDAYWHIATSLENTNADLWTDEDGTLWNVHANDEGLYLELTNEDDEVIQTLHLVVKGD